MGHNKRIRRERRRQRITAVALIVVVLLGSYVLSTLYDFSDRLRVTFVAPVSGARQDYLLEVADTPAKRAKGLMYRKQLDRRGGMIFLGEEDIVQKFWMRNTYIPLDIIFIDREKKVVGVIDSAPVLSEEPRFVEKPSRFVVELAGGTAAKDGIVVGSMVEFNHPQPEN